MTNLQALATDKSVETIRIVEAPRPTRVDVKGFSQVPVKVGPTGIKLYGMSHEHFLLYEMLSTVAEGSITIDGYVAPWAVRLESVPRALPSEEVQPVRPTVSEVKPELIGLGLGGVFSFGVGMFALATHNTGLATVMAGPFLASILGFALLFTGLKRKKQ